MFMTNSDIILIKATRTLFSDHGEHTAAQFYKRLLTSYPALRPLFSGDQLTQRRKLAATVTLAIDSLRDWDRISPALEALGRRHLTYGVKKWHYDCVGAELLATLKNAGVNEDTLAAWSRLYDNVSQKMLTGAYGSTFEVGREQGIDT